MKRLVWLWDASSKFCNSITQIISYPEIGQEHIFLRISMWIRHISSCIIWFVDWNLVSFRLIFLDRGISSLRETTAEMEMRNERTSSEEARRRRLRFDFSSGKQIRTRRDARSFYLYQVSAGFRISA